jgi:hypothetical protein
MNMQTPVDAPSFKRNLGLSIVRAAVAAGLARIDRKQSAAEHAEQQWPFDRDAQLLTRAATVPLDTSNTAALIQVALAMLPMLAPFSAAAQLFGRGLEVTFARESGAFTIPGLSQLAVAFVAEGAPKPAVMGTATAARIDPHKIAGIAVVSSELFAQPSIEAIMQRLLSESSGPVLDLAVFSADAGSAERPPGILNGVAAIPADTGPDAFLADLKALAGALAPVSGASPIAFIMNPVQAVSALYRASREVPNVFASAAVPAGTVIAVAVNALVSAMGVPSFVTATQATVHMSDTPTPLLGTPTASMYQTASVAIRMDLPVTWGLRSPNAVAFIEGADW